MAEALFIIAVALTLVAYATVKWCPLCERVRQRYGWDDYEDRPELDEEWFSAATPRPAPMPPANARAARAAVQARGPDGKWVKSAVPSRRFAGPERVETVADIVPNGVALLSDPPIHQAYIRDEGMTESVLGRA